MTEKLKKPAKSKMVLVVVDAPLKRKIDKYCKDHGISMKALVTSSIINYMRGASV